MIRSVLLILSAFLWWSCANQTQPSGGPKDEDPPLLISSIPQSGTLNFPSQTIQLEFSEMIKVDKLQAELIITPSITSKYKTRVARNRVTLTFEEPFNDSTTYTLNFRESIKDVTESNPVEDLIIVFSTGPVIDSLEISGFVTDLLTAVPAQNYVVALYSDRDTMDLFNASPLYAIKSETDGSFHFRNIKSDPYRIYAWHDKNNDLQCQSQNEPYAYDLQPIQLDSNQVDIDLYAQSLNLRPLTITAARQQGQYFEARFSKPTISYSITSPTLSDSIYHHYIDNKKAIRIYNTLPEAQLYSLVLSASDSAGYTIADTLEFTFEETSRPTEEFQSRIISSTLKSTNKQFETLIQFNKPIKPFVDTSWFFTIDSIALDLSQFSPTWDWVNNQLTVMAQLPDSLTEKKNLSITYPVNAFQSIESDTSQLMTQKINHLNPDNFGIIELVFENDSIPFKVHLLDSKGDFKEEYPGSSKLTLEYLNAGQYQIRVLFDPNEDGIWNPGNYYQNQNPEPLLFFFDEEANTSLITLKKNWVLGPFIIPLTVDN